MVSDLNLPIEDIPMETTTTEHSESGFECDHCGRIFNYKSNLNDHRNIHKGIRFECRYKSCLTDFSSKRNLNRHIQIVHTKELPLVRCNFEGCQYSTVYSYLLKKHQSVHTGERPFKCHWPDCGRSFRLLENLHTHRNIHENKPRFKCDSEGCKYASHQRDKLKRHKESIHEKNRVDKTASGIDLPTNYNSDSSEDRPFKCDWPECGRAFRLLSYLSEHRKIHERKPRFKCEWEGCKYATHRNSNLQRHLKLTHLKNMIEYLESDDHQQIQSTIDSNFDEDEFVITANDIIVKLETSDEEMIEITSKKRKAMHEKKKIKMKIDNGTPPIQSLSSMETSNHIVPLLRCDFEDCRYTTHRISTFKRHRAFHSDERPHQCPHCEQSFKTLDTLCKHKKIHEKQSCFKCDFEGCDYTTDKDAKLQRHRKSIHATESEIQSTTERILRKRIKD